ncbi:hypothetical protein V2W45_1349102 [Cenococcum geophilum]
MHRWALEGCEKVFRREHLDTLTIANNLGSVLPRQGKYEETEAMHRRALEGCEKGKYEEAEAMYRRALEAKEKVLRREHPDMLTSANNLGLVLLS